jgi:hypothetical protein
MSELSVEEKIGQRYYESKVVVPFVSKPYILICAAGTLSPEEIEQLPSIKREYDLAIEHRKEQRRLYDEDTKKLMLRFRQDCLESLFMDPNSKVANLLYDKAWSDGHSGGLREVYNHLYDMLDIYTEHVKEVEYYKHQKWPNTQMG